jgi:hypothetical protein
LKAKEAVNTHYLKRWKSKKAVDVFVTATERIRRQRLMYNNDMEDFFHLHKPTEILTDDDSLYLCKFVGFGRGGISEAMWRDMVIATNTIMAPDDICPECWRIARLKQGGDN